MSLQSLKPPPPPPQPLVHALRQSGTFLQSHVPLMPCCPPPPPPGGPLVHAIRQSHTDLLSDVPLLSMFIQRRAPGAIWHLCAPGFGGCVDDSVIEVPQ